MIRNWIMVLLCLAAVTVQAQDKKKKYETYNYLRAMECVQEMDYSKALEYLQKDVEENPKSGYSYVYIAALQMYFDETGEALTASNKAIQYIPKKDQEKLAEAYDARASVYLALEDTVSALNDLEQAIKLQPKDEDLYKERAQIYYEQDKYDLADADYQKYIELQPGDVVGYMGLGRNANERKQWDKAIEQFNHVEKLTSEYSSVYSFRAESYLGLKKYREAIDDLIKAIDIDYDTKALLAVAALDKEAYPEARTKFKLKALQNPNDAKWPFCQAMLESKQNNYKNALEFYKKANEIEEDGSYNSMIIDCYENMGDYDNAIKYVDEMLEEDSTDTDAISKKALLLLETGQFDEALRTAKSLFTGEESYTDYNFYLNGYMNLWAGNYNDAVEDFNMAISIDNTVPGYYFSRARAYNLLKQNDEASADYRKIVELEEDTTDYSYNMYAYVALGEYDNAVNALKYVLGDEPTYNDLYNAACVYSLMNKKDEALDYLRKSFENGWRGFKHLEWDTDMDNIRNTDEYKALVEKYKAIHKQEMGDNSQSDLSTNMEHTVTEVPFTKEQGVCKVKCDINGLPLHFVFDTGASDVTISMVEANFMFKNGYLSSNDIIGKQNYIDANGNVSEGTVINLKNVNFGGLELTNVKASVVRNQKAPLLLGQTVLGKAGKIEIDNAKKVLRISK